MTREKIALVERIDKLSLKKMQDEIFSHKSLYSLERAHFIDFHKYTKHIPVRGPICASAYDRNFNKYNCFINGIQSKYTNESDNLPVVRNFLENFAKRHNYILGRAQVVLLSGLSEVFIHVDYGYYYALHDRYHLVISSKGSVMISGDTKKIFKEGDLFFYENRIPHSASNENQSERIHLIFDVMSANPFIIVYKFILWKILYKKYINYSLFKDSGYIFNDKNTLLYLLDALKLSLEKLR